MLTEAEKDPRKAGAQPPFDEKKQSGPGSSEAMQNQPDYGESSYRGSGRLAGRKALITGGDSGIGRAVALAFAREGADVLVSYLNEDEDANETLRLVKDAGQRGAAVAGDIGDFAHCQKLVERTVQEFGGIDILVNNAAFQMSHESLDQFSPEEWDHTFKTNIYAMFYLAKMALPQMQPGSSVINTTSVQAYQPSPQLLAYATTKGAIVTFTKGLAQLAMEDGIRVNAVAPGPVWTPLIPATMPEEQVRKFGKTNPHGRPAQPVELAPAYVFLASDESRYVTGSIMDLTGGKMLP